MIEHLIFLGAVALGHACLVALAINVVHGCGAVGGWFSRAVRIASTVRR